MKRVWERPYYTVYFHGEWTEEFTSFPSPKDSFQCDGSTYKQKKELRQERERLQELADNFLDMLFEDNLL